MGGYMFQKEIMKVIEELEWISYTGKSKSGQDWTSEKNPEIRRDVKEREALEGDWGLGKRSKKKNKESNETKSKGNKTFKRGGMHNSV